MSRNYCAGLLDVNVNVTYMAAMLVKAQTKTETSSWSIREFSELFEITPRALRFYEDKDLISPDRSTGARIYGAVEHTKMTNILRAKRLGFTLDDIKVVLDVTDGRVTDRAELVTRRSNFQRVIKSLKRRRTDIDILSQHLTELCQIMDEQLENTDENTEVIQLAEAYDQAFRQHLSSENHLNEI